MFKEKKKNTNTQKHEQEVEARLSTYNIFFLSY